MTSVTWAWSWLFRDLGMHSADSDMTWALTRHSTRTWSQEFRIQHHLVVIDVPSSNWKWSWQLGLDPADSNITLKSQIEPQWLGGDFGDSNLTSVNMWLPSDVISGNWRATCQTWFLCFGLNFVDSKTILATWAWLNKSCPFWHDLRDFDDLKRTLMTILTSDLIGTWRWQLNQDLSDLEMTSETWYWPLWFRHDLVELDTPCLISTWPGWLKDVCSTLGMTSTPVRSTDVNQELHLSNLDLIVVTCRSNLRFYGSTSLLYDLFMSDARR